MIKIDPEIDSGVKRQGVDHMMLIPKCDSIKSSSIKSTTRPLPGTNKVSSPTDPAKVDRSLTSICIHIAMNALGFGPGRGHLSDLIDELSKENHPERDL